MVRSSTDIELLARMLHTFVRLILHKPNKNKNIKHNKYRISLRISEMGSKANQIHFSPEECARLTAFIKENGIYRGGKCGQTLKRQQLWNQISHDLGKDGVFGKAINISAINCG